ncbi:alpha/beta fold hydrolase [Haliscomenobacter sp.]|uniref:alpha/beta fold hydrolase n=1 Tax=Haliscomenobacter sp. TaxID=2717303 RepID=UPI0035949015
MAFTRSLLNDQAWFESLWAQRNVLQDKPMLFIWGMKDSVIKPKNLDKFLDGFPHAMVKQLPTAGHFPQGEQPDQVTAILREFLISHNGQTAKKI